MENNVQDDTSTMNAESKEGKNESTEEEGEGEDVDVEILYMASENREI